VPAIVRSWHQITTQALRAALAGRAAARLPPLDLSAGTEFQRRVWRVLRQLGSGQTRGYGEVARMLGLPGAARVVGNACSANPIPVFVPCHRVLAARGKLGGFSAGLKWKRLLLERERMRTQSVRCGSARCPVRTRWIQADGRIERRRCRARPSC
jgi:O-6-methylguanine DNA methyltransferase